MNARLTLSAAALLALSSQAHGGSFFNSLQGGLNTLEDQDREVLFDLNGNGIFDSGDALVGFLRLDDANPSGVSYNSSVFAVFAQEVISDVTVAVGTNTAHSITLAPIGTTAATASVATLMSTLTGNVWGAGSEKIAELYEDNPGSVNYITTAPSAVADGAAGLTIFDFVAAIAGGTLATEIGCVSCNAGGSDFWSASALIPTAGDPFATLGVLNALTLAGGIPGTTGFTAGLTIQSDSSGPIDFADTVVITGLSPPTYSLAVVNGGLSGAADRCYGPAGSRVNPFFSAAATCDTVASGVVDFGVLNGGAATGAVAYYGFSSNADFAVDVILLPEPLSVALMGSGLLMAGFASRRRSQRQS